MTDHQSSTPTVAVYSPSAGCIVYRGQNMDDAIDYARRQNAACAKAEGYGDRRAYTVDSDGFLRDENGGHVWPSHGRSAGAIHV